MAGRAAKLASKLLPPSSRKLPLVRQPLPSLSMCICRRAFSLYDQINVLPGVPEDRIRIDGCTDTGFIANGVEYEGSILCINNLILSWQPKQLSEVTPESLSIFQVIKPAPEILVVGCGKRTVVVDSSIRKYLRSNGIKLEAVDSWNAAATFNFLNEEGRMTAAALLPVSVECPDI